MRWLSKIGKDDNLLVASQPLPSLTFLCLFPFFLQQLKKLYFNVSMLNTKASRDLDKRVWQFPLGAPIRTKTTQVGTTPYTWLTEHTLGTFVFQQMFIVFYQLVYGFIPSSYMVKYPHHVIIVSLFSCFFAYNNVPCNPSALQDALPNHIMHLSMISPSVIEGRVIPFILYGPRVTPLRSSQTL